MSNKPIKLVTTRTEGVVKGSNHPTPIAVAPPPPPKDSVRAVEAKK